MARLEAMANRSTATAPPVLGRPSGEGRKFYDHLAAGYQELVTQGVSPAVCIADEAGVPVTTVHRWIHTARAYGYLPPARQERAG